MNWKVIVHYRQPEGEPRPALESEEITAEKPPKESLDQTELVVNPVGDGPERRIPLSTVAYVEAWPIRPSIEPPPPQIQ